MKFTKPTPPAKTTIFNPATSSAAHDEEAFPSLEADNGEESVFARMKQHKPTIPVAKKKAKQTSKVPTAAKASMLDRQDRANEPLERHGRKAGRLQVDTDYYYNDRGASDEEVTEPIDIPPPKEELVQVKPKDLRRAEFPELGGNTRAQEADLFERMKTAKRSQLEELASKFGYGQSRGGLAPQNVPVVAVKKKKK
jgi:hypothetical protein